MSYSTTRSRALFERIKGSIAGGESSYARARRGIALCIDHTAGCRMWDVDGNEYIDYCLGYGPLFFGHNPHDIIDAVVEQISTRGYHFSFPHELDYKVGEAVQRLVPSVDLLRFTCSGTEATMAAMRLARAYTGKDKIIKFEGAYHGWSDLNYVSYSPGLGLTAGRPNAPRAIADSSGTVLAAADALIVQPFNDLEVIEQTIRARHFEIAGVLIEPIMGNCGVIPPTEGYLQEVRRLTAQYGVLLIFDEVMTGFRVAAGGAQEYYNIQPDISTFAKALGGGFPVAAFGGTREVMALEARNDVMHGGTYTANPLVLAAAHAVLQRIEREKETLYPRLFALSARLRAGLVRVIRAAGFHCLDQGVGPFFQVFIGDSHVERLYNYRDTTAYVRGDLYSAWQQEMQRRGVYVNPTPTSRWFISTAHTEGDIDHTIAVADEAIRAVAGRFAPSRRHAGGSVGVTSLASARVVVRPGRPEDVDALCAIRAEPDVARWWGNPEPREEVAAALLGSTDEVLLVIEVVGEVAGGIQYHEELEPDYRHASIDVYLGTRWQGCGLGTEAVRLVARYLFEQCGHHRLTIDPAADNARAIASYAKVGFRPVGIMRQYERGPDGRWHDGLLMDLLRDELVP